jgi:hypothetical protein
MSVIKRLAISHAPAATPHEVADPTLEGEGRETMVTFD